MCPKPLPPIFLPLSFPFHPLAWERKERATRDNVSVASNRKDVEVETPPKQERDPFTDLRRLLWDFDWDAIRLRLNHIKRDAFMT